MSKQPRFHIRESDDLYQPIPFLFVTERMCAEILAEREGDRRHRQPAGTAQAPAGPVRALPPVQVSADAFGGLALNLFGNPANKLHGADRGWTPAGKQKGDPEESP